MSIREFSIFCSITIAALPVYSQEKSPGAVFIENGNQTKIAEASGAWKKVAGALEAEGAGSKLIAGQQIGPGDFTIRAELALEKMDRSAAVFKMAGSFLHTRIIISV